MKNTCALLFISVVTFWSPVFATEPTDIVDLAAFYHHAQDAIRTGIEVEFSGLTLEEATKIVQGVVGGQVEFAEFSKEISVEENGKIIRTQKILRRSKIKKNSTGMRLVIKPEANETSGVVPGKNQKKSLILELLTDPGPIDYRGVEELQKALDALLKAGATGTRKDVAVSLQVNVEMGQGLKENFHAKDLVNLLRNYLDPVHRQQIETHYQIPEVRKHYIQPLSAGFMQRLMDPAYEPSLEQLKDDLLYRQLSELLNDPAAWDAPIEEIKKNVLLYITETDAFTLKESPLFRVIKFSPLKLSSLLLYAFPEDALAKILKENLWIKLIPAIEFRDRNNDFNVKQAVKEAVGFVRMSEALGQIHFDPAQHGTSSLLKHYTDHEIQKISQATGLREKDIRRTVATALLKGDSTNVVRILWANPKVSSTPDTTKEMRYLLRYPYNKTSPLLLPARGSLSLPWLVPGESVVFHPLVEMASVVVGAHNPGVINSFLAIVMTDKYVEAKFLEKYVPGAMPKTLLLRDAWGASSVDDIAQLRQKLDRQFPKGWVLKGVRDHATDASFLVSSETDLQKEVDIYRNSNFLAEREKILERQLGADPDAYVRALRNLEGYRGFRINRMMKETEWTIVQEKMSIKSEYRVEVVAGRVLGNGSTIDRYSYKNPDTSKLVENPEEALRVEKTVQKFIDQIPWELRGFPMGLDAAVLSDGTIKIIETNPQGNSGFLMYQPESIRALNRFLKSYPQLLAEGRIPTGLTATQQLDFINDFLKEIGIDPKIHFKELDWWSNGVKDPVAESRTVPEGPVACKNIF